MARPLINEAALIDAHLMMATLTVPTFLAHGTLDSRLPYEVSARLHKTAGEHRFLTIEGADHGFTAPGDEDYTHPQTRVWQAQVFEEAVAWIERATAQS
jgi:uncharacterized protein